MGSAKPPENGRTGSKTPSEEMAIYKKRSSMTRTPSIGEEGVDTSNVNLGFTGEPSRSSGQKGMRGSSMSESRKRIAQAVGRKPSS